MNNTSTIAPRIAAQLVEIDALTEQNISNEDYFSRLLSSIVDYAQATRGAIWQIGSAGLELMVVSLQNEDFIREAASDREFADHIIQSQRSEYRRLDSDESPNMVQFGIPLFNHEVCFGTLIVDYAATGQMDAEMMLGDLTEMSNRVRKNFLFSHFASAADDLRKHRLAQSVVDGIGKHIDTKPLAFEVVNRLQKYLKADRASLAFRKGHSYVMKGISNQAVFDRRSKVVRGQEQLAKKVAQTQNPLWYPAERNEMAPSIRELMDKYLESSNGVSVAFLPVFGEQNRRDDPEDIAATIKPEELRKEPIGVLVLESFEQPLDAARIRRRWARIAKPVCQSIDNARRFESILLMPVWRTLGHAADWYRGHTRRKAFLITGAIAGVIALLTLLPADFKLRGDGVIQPLQRQHVFAEIDGTVKRLFVDDGQVVERGDLLVDLKNPELATRMAETEGKYNESRQRLDTLTVQRITRAFENEEEERELVRNFSTTRARVEGLEKQLNLLKQSTDRLRINSPLAGSVVTWDTEQRLMDRPVKQGERLLTVADLSGGWEVELRIPDKRAGYVLKEWNQRQSNESPIGVSFVLASDPTTVFRGTAFEVSPASNVDDKESENVVRVRVKLSDSEFAKMDRVKPGTTVIGHVHCGRASLGYCKLFEFFDWARRTWFKFVA